MTKAQFVTGIAVTALIVMAGFVATPFVNRAIPAAQPTAPSQDACVDTGRRWKNWSWPNVPWLSPPCEQQTAPGQQG